MKQQKISSLNIIGTFFLINLGKEIYAIYPVINQYLADTKTKSSEENMQTN